MRDSLSRRDAGTERRFFFLVTTAGTSSATSVFFDRASNLADLRLLTTLWRQTMRLAQIIIFLVGALAAVGLLMESMASYGADAL